MSDKVKLIIEIPKYYLEHPQDYTCLAECVRRGTPIPDNATNGDILKTLIPMDCYGDEAEKFYGYIEWNCSKWWNAPYQKGDK